MNSQREAWETQYALAHERWLAHKAQVAQAMEAETTGAPAEDQQRSYSSAGAASEGTLASDEQLAALREQLAGFYLIEAADQREAEAIAAKIPPASLGCVEVRPLRQLPQR